MVIIGIFTCFDIVLTKLNIDYCKRKIIIGHLIYSKKSHIKFYTVSV